MLSLKLTKDPGDDLVETSRLSAITQPATIVSTNVEPKLKPGADQIRDFDVKVAWG